MERGTDCNRREPRCVVGVVAHRDAYLNQKGANYMTVGAHAENWARSYPEQAEALKNNQNMPHQKNQLLTVMSDELNKAAEARTGKKTASVTPPVGIKQQPLPTEENPNADMNPAAPATNPKAVRQSVAGATPAQKLQKTKDLVDESDADDEDKEDADATLTA